MFLPLLRVPKESTDSLWSPLLLLSLRYSHLVPSKMRGPFQPMVFPLPGRSILYRPEILGHPPFMGACSLSASHPSSLLRCLQAAVYVTPEELLPSDQPVPLYLA